jgi:hypothetical protein
VLTEWILDHLQEKWRDFFLFQKKKVARTWKMKKKSGGSQVLRHFFRVSQKCSKSGGKRSKHLK